ncbi:MAG: (d)CMP kinase [Phycisphaerae bacterium]|nr:(d)CMP kinase [Phycisphaerae bacterium]
MPKLIITIDGPAGSGKSTTARLLAEKIGAAFLDTGAMYRAVTVAAMRSQLDLGNVETVEKLIDSADFKFEITNNQMAVKINNKDITEQIRDPKVTENVRFIASQPSLRSRLVKMQQNFAQKYQKIVTEGRDQGTVVFPDADYKFFLTADSARRTKRRAEELTEKGLKVDLTKLRKEIEIRDAADKNRNTGPLVPAKDAVIIDNTNLTLEQTVNEILKIINKNS